MITDYKLTQRIRFKSRDPKQEPGVHGKEAVITRLPTGQGPYDYLFFIKFDANVADGAEIGVSEDEIEPLSVPTA